MVGGSLRGLSRVDPKTLYRQEALLELQRSRAGGDLLRLSREWLAWAYWMLVISAVTGVALALVTRVYAWAPGPAAVRLGGRTDVTATTPGTVLKIEVHAGQHVERNQLLVRFSGITEQHELESANAEFQAQLVRALRDPADQATLKDLSRLRAQKELAEAKLADRSVRAPRAGTVTDIRIRPNQLLSPGEIILTLADDQRRPQVVALLPGYARPQLRPGMTMRFEPTSFEFAYQDVVIDSVGDEVLGPSEIRRYLGPELADALLVAGPSIIVTAMLPTNHFTSDGKTYSFSHGLPGQAQARLRTRTVLMEIISMLRGMLKPEAPKAGQPDGQPQ
jgi:membrane fusion protein (multidrug efflux system)